MTYEKHPVPSDAESNEYATPRWLTKQLARTLPTDGDKFDLDPASGAENEPHAHTRYTKEDGGRRSEWFGWVWCNPPWSSPANDGRMKESWLRTGTAHVENGNIDGLVMLLPDGVDTGWFDTYASSADYITFAGRISFTGSGNPSFGCMLLTWGDVPGETVNELIDIGPTFKGPKLTGRQEKL